MANMLDALKKAGLVSEARANQIAAGKRQKLQKETEQRLLHAEFHGIRDEEAQRKEEAFLRRAAQETRKPSSRVGTKQYFDRFKK